LASNAVDVEDASLTDFDSLEIGAMNLGSHGFEWHNSDFCSSAVNLKSVTNSTMSVHDDFFDVDTIDLLTGQQSTLGTLSDRLQSEAG